MDIPITKHDPDEDSQAQRNESPTQPDESKPTKINVTTDQEASNDDTDKADVTTTAAEEVSPNEATDTAIEPEPPEEKTESVSTDSDSALEDKIILPKKDNKSQPARQLLNASSLTKLGATVSSFLMSRWRIVRRRFNNLSIKQQMAAGAMAAVLMVAGGLYMLLHPSNNPQSEITSDVNGSVASSQLSQLERGTPDYQTITPAGQAAEELDWAKVSPEGSDPVYAYSDAIDDTPITVSQQPVPGDFKNDTAEKVEELARDFGALENIVASGTTVYIGASAEGQQSVIFTKQNLLVLIKTNDIVSRDKLISYISSLQ